MSLTNPISNDGVMAWKKLNAPLTVYEGNPTVTGEFPLQRLPDAELFCYIHIAMTS